MNIQTTPQEDLFWKYKKIYCGNASNKIIAELKKICQIEKIFFENLPIVTPWAKDPILLRGDNSLLFPARIKNRIESQVFILDFLVEVKQLFYEEGRPFQQSVMGWVLNSNLQERFIKANFHRAKEAPFYFEGGNLLKVQNRSGKSMYLSGPCNLLYTLLNAGSIPYYWAKKEEILKKAKAIPKDAPLFGQKKFEDLDLFEKSWTDEEKKLAVRILYALAEVIKETIAKKLKIPVLHLGHFLEAPPDYHLDLFLLPAPGGVVFLQDHNLAWQLLESIKKNNHCSQSEIKRLELYQQSALYAIKEDEEKLNRMEEALTCADFTVVRVAGAFFSNGVKKRVAVNFLNAVVGIGKDCAYCITNAGGHPAERLLQNHWLEIMQKHDIRNVYFMEEPNEEFAKSGGGVHCLLQTVSHLEEDYDFRLEESENLNCEEIDYFSRSMPLLLKEIMKDLANDLPL